MIWNRLFRGARTKTTQRNARRAQLSVEGLESREVLSTTSYLVPTAAGVSFTPILTTGDTVGSYTMAGTPDGLGAFDNGDGTFTVLMNYEFSLGEAVGVAHAHNASLLTDGNPATNPAGSHVDRLVIRKSDLAVLSGGDQIQMLLDGNTFAPLTGTALNLDRLCSADLPALTAFYNPATGLGTQARIFLDGEETAGGRALAHIVTGPNNGISYTLPLLRTAAWENLLANPASGDTTLVIGNDDTTPSPTNNGGKLYVYVGTKLAAGNEIQRAGLTNGTTYFVQDIGGGRFSLVTSGGTQFKRPEDGAWDPNHPNDYYFVTTDSFTGNTQLFRLRFDDASNPTAGGTIEVLINGQGVAKMFDNIAVDGMGRIILQEDVGNNARVGKVWLYDIASGALVELAQHDPNQFVSGAPNFLTQDEESSGVIDMSGILGEGTYMLDIQAHYPNPNPALVQGGQLLLMRTGAIAGLGYNGAAITASTPATPNALVELGTSGNDHIEVTQRGNTFDVRVGNALLATRTGVIDRIFAVGYDGNDHIDLSGAQANSSVYGGDGNDHLVGSSGANYLNGGSGNDKLDVSASNKVNRLQGGDGNDQFIAGAVDILIDFGNGNDNLKKKK